MYMTKIKSIFCKSYKYLSFFQMLLNVYMYMQKFELKSLVLLVIINLRPCK